MPALQRLPYVWDYDLNEAQFLDWNTPPTRRSSA